MTDTPELEAVSLEWERQTGYDSIATIKRIYDRAPSGAYQCVWLGCKFARKDAAELWKHVHTAHGTASLPPMVADAQEAEAAREAREGE